MICHRISPELRLWIVHHEVEHVELLPVLAIFIIHVEISIFHMAFRNINLDVTA